MHVLINLQIVNFNHLLPIAACYRSLTLVLILIIKMILGILVLILIKIHIFLNMQSV